MHAVGRARGEMGPGRGETSPHLSNVISDGLEEIVCDIEVLELREPQEGIWEGDESVVLQAQLRDALELPKVRGKAVQATQRRMGVSRPHSTRQHRFWEAITCCVGGQVPSHASSFACENGGYAGGSVSPRSGSAP